MADPFARPETHEQWASRIGLGSNGTWTDTHKKIFQRSVIVQCALAVIDQKTQKKPELEARILKEFLAAVDPDKGGLDIPQGATSPPRYGSPRRVCALTLRDPQVSPPTH